MSLRDEVKSAVAVLSPGETVGDGTTPPSPPRRASTSDLTIDETLLLHAAGWEPVDLVYGISWWSIPWGAWQWRAGEVEEASQAFAGAMGQAAKLLQAECTRVAGAGVIGVEVGLHISSHHAAVELAGTAVRPSQEGVERAPFLSDLSARDFVLLTRAGWWPLGLAAGASFVLAPRRSAREWAAQKSQNVELPNLTQALYLARARAMERMQRAGSELNSDGIVAVKLREGRASSSARVIQFVSIGTGVRLDASSHRGITPAMVVTLDERTRQFDLKSLRGAQKPGH